MGDADSDRYGELLVATLLVPTPDDPPVAGTWSKVDLDVVTTLLDDSGATLRMVACTDVEALVGWRPDGGAYVERDGAWVFGVASADPDGGVVIDPGTSRELVIVGPTLLGLAEGQVPGAGGQMLIATPREGLADDVTDAVRAALGAEGEVVAARLFLVDQTGDGPQPMVMVELDEGLDEALVGEVMGRVVQGIADRTEHAAGLTFALVTPEWRSTFDTGGIELYRR